MNVARLAKGAEYSRPQVTRPMRRMVPVEPQVIGAKMNVLDRCPPVLSNEV